MTLAIVGSVSLKDNARAMEIIEAVLDRYKPDKVVSGGADGIDTMAARAADLRGIVVKEHLPATKNWHGYSARNLKIARDCDALVRIVSTTSRTYGSGWTRDRAKEMGKPTQEFVVA